MDSSEVLERGSTEELLGEGLTAHRAGHLTQAEASYRLVLERDSNHPAAMHLLGVMMHQSGRHIEAEELIGRAIQLRPADVEMHNNFGAVLSAMGKRDEAIGHYRRAIELNPNYAEAHNNLGAELNLKQMHGEAIECFRTAVRLRGDYARAHANLAAAAALHGDSREAVEHGRIAVALRPDWAEAHCNLGVALQRFGQSDEAAASFRVAIELMPNYAEAMSNLGGVLQAQGRLDEAIAMYGRAIAVRSDYAEAHLNRALALLAKGDYVWGWEEYEWRWRMPDGNGQEQFGRPAWDGSALNQKTILLEAEQGLGDTIQFIRYADLVARMGGKIIVRCQRGLKSLLAGSFDFVQVIEEGEALPVFDVHCPLLSLPRVLGTKVESIPGKAPYLRADGSLAARYRACMKGDGVRVGVAWAGNPANTEDRHRSIAADRLAPLARIAGVEWYSLQKGAGASAAGETGLKLIDWTDEFTDFAHTAGMIENLDAVISVDTAIVHLAGAMGKRGWVLLSFSSHFSWFLERSDSPWYPTMKLIRQPLPGDWEGVVACVGRELEAFIQGAGKR